MDNRSKYNRVFFSLPQTFDRYLRDIMVYFLDF